MKQKFTITVADIEMNVVSDESPEAVEAIVGVLDRRMREIRLKSGKCSKTEAALLCSLDYCAEKIKLQRALKELQGELDKACAKCEALEKKNQELSEKLDECGGKAAKGKCACDAFVVDDAQISIDSSAVPQNDGQSGRRSSKKRVRSMFDMITFDNV
jgi:cell division protein ZapA (FtsZ GTPase activity inhibitor)